MGMGTLLKARVLILTCTWLTRCIKPSIKLRSRREVRYLSRHHRSPFNVCWVTPTSYFDDVYCELSGTTDCI